MYANIGKKIMALTKICSWVTIVCSVIIWLIILADGNADNNTVAWIWLGVGILYFISSWTVYGFGQLIDDVHAMRIKSDIAAVVSNDELPEL